MPNIIGTCCRIWLIIKLGKKYDKVIWVSGTDHVTLSGGEMWIIKAHFKVVGFVALVVFK